MKHNSRYRVYHAVFTEKETGKRRSVRLSVSTDDIEEARQAVAERYNADNVALSYMTVPDGKERP